MLAHESAVLDASLRNIVPNLMKVFSSKEGYMEFSDTLPTRQLIPVVKNLQKVDS